MSPAPQIAATLAVAKQAGSIAKSFAEIVKEGNKTVQTIASEIGEYKRAQLDVETAQMARFLDEGDHRRRPVRTRAWCRH